MGAQPCTGIAGTGGLICVIWAMAKLGPVRGTRDLAIGLRTAGLRGWAQVAIGLVGFGLFLWSASPIATMR